MHPLDGASVKIQRAEEHLRSLEAEFRRLRENKPYTVVRDVHPDDGSEIFRIEPNRPPSRPNFDVIMADLVHNLRSALDQIAYGLAKPPTGSTAFPVWLDKTGHGGYSFEGDRGRDQVANMPPEAVELLERLQPYNRLKDMDPLWMLQQLWIDDKHKFIPVISLFVFTERIDTSPAEGTQDLPSEADMTPKAGDESDIVMRVPPGFHGDIDLVPEPSLYVRFDQVPRSYGGRYVLPTAKWLHYYLRNMVLPFFDRSWF